MMNEHPQWNGGAPETLRIGARPATVSSAARELLALTERANELELENRQHVALIVVLQHDLDRADARIQGLLAALWRWVPVVRGDDTALDEQAGNDALLLAGLDNPDAPELGQEFGEQLRQRVLELERQLANGTAAPAPRGPLDHLSAAERQVLESAIDGAVGRGETRMCSHRVPFERPCLSCLTAADKAPF